VISLKGKNTGIARELQGVITYVPLLLDPVSIVYHDTVFYSRHGIEIQGRVSACIATPSTPSLPDPYLVQPKGVAHGRVSLCRDVIFAEHALIAFTSQY
jgi:hypothetical protein